jgi:hypothetical protein
MKLLIILFTLFLTGCMSQEQKYDQCLEKYKKLTGSEFFYKNYLNVSMMCHDRSRK